jgi:hypothetical protein
MAYAVNSITKEDPPCAGCGKHGLLESIGGYLLCLDCQIKIGRHLQNKQSLWRKLTAFL